MGQITIDYCDRHDGRTDVRATHRGFQMEFDGKTYEIDLCELHYREIAEAAAPYILAARRVRATVTPLPPPPPSELEPPERRPARIDPAQARHIRAWCADNGIDVNPRGAIPKRALEAYHNREIRHSRPAKAQFCETREEFIQQALAWLMQRGEYVPQTGPTRPQLARYTEKTGWHPPSTGVAPGAVG